MDTAVQTCYRHPDRRAGVLCQRCDRPICPDCMQQASVGFHCPECTRSSGQRVLRASQLRVTPVVTNALVALNVAVFAAGLGRGLQTRDAFIIHGGLVGEGRVLEGVAIRPEVPVGELVGVAHGEWWRLVTSGFLHANLIHLAFNMLVLYQLGRLLEPVLGRVCFAVAYLAAMLTGGFGVLLLDPRAFTVGASGAVFGLMGVAVAVFRARGIGAFDTGLGGMIVLNLLITFTIPGISVGGHVGGLVGGLLAGWILTDLGPRVLRDDRLAVALVTVLGVAAAIGGVLVA